MSTTVELPDDLAARLATIAARRGVGVEQVAVELVAAGLTADEVGSAPRSRRHLSFAAVGASQTGQGSDDAEAMLAERFGRD